MKAPVARIGRMFSPIFFFIFATNMQQYIFLNNMNCAESLLKMNPCISTPRVIAATVVPDYIALLKRHTAFLASCKGWKLSFSLRIEITFVFSKCEVTVKVLHDCLSSWVFPAILNLLFRTEALILPCLWTVGITLSAVIWVLLQSRTEHSQLGIMWNMLFYIIKCNTCILFMR